MRRFYQIILHNLSITTWKIIELYRDNQFQFRTTFIFVTISPQQPLWTSLEAPSKLFHVLDYISVSISANVPIQLLYRFSAMIMGDGMSNVYLVQNSNYSLNILFRIHKGPSFPFKQCYTFQGLDVGMSFSVFSSKKRRCSLQLENTETNFPVFRLSTYRVPTTLSVMCP